MKISEIKEIIKAQLEMANEDRIVLCLVGQQGIGKTQAIQQVAKENGWDYKALYGAQAQVEDLRGIPQKNDETGETVFAKPVFLPSQEKTIFVLEDSFSILCQIISLIEIFFWKLGASLLDVIISIL